MAEYASPSYRKGKKDKKMKRRYRVYKRGGKERIREDKKK